ncbi:TolC family protein [Rhodopirellula sp. JC639]|uniref:TolC family protein n=1 Tax=Stieleria mannarensis TaxID=2755585 RepID=UPI00336A887C
MKKWENRLKFIVALTVVVFGHGVKAEESAVGRIFLPPPPVPQVPDALDNLDSAGQDDHAFAASNRSADVVIDVNGRESLTDDRPPGAGAYGLQDFLSLACQHNPTLRQARLQISAETAKALQAGLYPNPFLRYTGEQIGVDVEGDKDSPGEFQGMIVSQRFVTAGKLRLSREKYMRRAHVSQHLAMAQQFRVCNDVRIHFYRALAAKEHLNIRQEFAKTAEDFAVTAQELFNEGQATRPEVRKANIELQRARLAVLSAENACRQLFRELLSVVGVSLTEGQLQGELLPQAEPLSYQAALARVLSESPEIAAARAKLASDRVTIQREKVQWIPDVVAEGGAGYNFDAKETTATAGLGIQVPIFDRNQGTIRQAELDFRRQQHEIRRTELELEQRLAAVYQQYLSALQVATEYKRMILPEARLAYEELLKSYQDNRVDWPTVLTAQKDYATARLDFVTQSEQIRINEVLIRGYLLHGGLTAAPGPSPPGHIDSVPKPR